MRVPLSAGDRVSPAYERADGGYAANWAPPDRPVLRSGVVYLFSHRCRWSARGSRRDEGEDMDTDLAVDLLARARAGDEDAFGELVAPYRHELQVHCYRILGSLQDAEDVLQETLLSAWRGLDGFEERVVGAHLALPHRDQPQPRRRPRRLAAGARRELPHPRRRTPRADAGTARCRGCSPSRMLSSTWPTPRPAPRR